jgi:uncharacterized repeat protein (TIGR01451 family)/CSLREA domain-containing protein
MPKKFLHILALLIPLIWMSVAFPAPARAATITVNTLTDEPLSDPDNGNCSIREAIQAANTDTAVDACTAGGGADIINFGVSGTIDLSASGDGELNITTNITIDGGTNITLTGNNATRIIRVNSAGNLSLQNITLTQGNGNGGSGGAILVDNGATLNVLNSNFNNNNANSNGGAISSSGTLDIENAVFQNNVAQQDGGAIYHSSNASMTIETAAFINNSAGANSGYGDGSGGAIFHNGSSSAPSSITAAYFLSNSVTNATSADGGGAIYHGTSGVLAITASAFFDNSASGDDARGGAVYNASGDNFAMTINYSHFGEVFSLPIPPIPPIKGVDIVAAIGSGSGNRVVSTSATTAGGGAIYNNGYLHITGSSLVANSSSNHGGAIFNNANSTDTYPQPLGQGIIIANSTIANNGATNNGGALYHGNTDDLIELVNVTISNNVAASGMGIFNAGDGESPNQSPFDEVYLVNVILNNNSCAGGSLGNGNSSVSGNNVLFTSTCDIRQQDAGSSPAVPIVTDPLLGTPTIVFTPATIFTVVIPLGTGSSASGTGDNTVCTSFPVLSLDQRLAVRPDGEPACDIGAYESDQVTPVEIEVRDVTNTVVIADGDASPDLADGTDMGATPVGTPITATFNINNVGGGVLNVGIITVSNPTYFSVTQVADNTIDAGDFEPFTVTCLATDGGTYTTTVTIPNNDSDENPYDFVVRCVVQGPEIEVRDAANVTLINIGDTVPIGTTPVGSPITVNLRINNIGNQNLNISSVSVTGDFSIVTPIAPPAFSIGGSGFDFEPLTIQCSATTAGLQTGVVTIASNDANEPSYTFNVTCNVTATAPNIRIFGNSTLITNGDVTPDLADHTQFVTTVVGVAVTRTYTIENNGTANLVINGATISNDPNPFTFVSTPALATIAPGDTLNFTVQCMSMTAGSYVETLTILSNDPDFSDATYSFNLGCQVDPLLPNIRVFGNSTLITNGDVTPDLADHTQFVTTVVGVAVTRTYTIENNGTANLVINGATLSNDPNPFTFVSTPALATIAPGDTLNFTVQCMSMTAGSYVETLTILSNDPDFSDATYSFNLGCQVNDEPEIEVYGNSVLIVDGDTTPSLLDHTDFGTTTVGTPITRTFTIVNIGSQNLNITLPVTVADVTNFDVSLQPTTPLNPPLIGNDTVFQVQCLAVSNGIFTTTVTINNDDSDENPFTFDIRCNVGGLDLAVNKTVSNPTPLEGDTIIYSITVTNGGTINATNVVITDLLPTGVTYVSDNAASLLDGASNPTSYNAGTGLWTIGQLNAATSLTLQITATVDVGTSGDTITNTATLTALDQVDTDSSNDSDDVDIVVGTSTPIIEVRGNGVVIPEGNIPSLTDHTLFTPTPPLTPTSRTFTINNIGTGSLTVSVTPLSAPFSITAPPTSPIGAAGSTTFTIECNPPAVGSFTAVVEIINNDATPGANPYTFNIECNGVTNAPEINVQGNSVTILDNDTTPSLLDHTDFGTTSVGIPITRTFTIQNLGIDDLTLGAITVPAGFSISTAPVSPVTGGNSTQLGITCNAATQNSFSGTVSIPNNDSNENPYTFDITCSVLAAGTPADLSLSKIVDDLTPAFGQILTYTVTVQNVGPGATTGVQVVDIFPTSVTFLAVGTVSQGTVTVDISNTFLTWDIGTLTNPQTVTLTYTVQVNPTVGTTYNYAQITNSDVLDPNSTPNNGIPPTPIEDDEGSIAFLFDPPFGTKAFVYDGVSVIEWTIVWVNPTNNPIPVSMNDPLLGGTTYIAGSLSCTTPGTTTITTCVHNPVTNTIEFVGIIDPDPGATPATINTANNRLIITYRVQVPDGVNSVSNTATLTDTDTDESYIVTNTFTRTTPPSSGGGTPPLTAEQIQGMVKALPATGETPLWAEMARVVLVMSAVIGGAGLMWLVFRKRVAG